MARGSYKKDEIYYNQKTAIELIAMAGRTMHSFGDRLMVYLAKPEETDVFRGSVDKAATFLLS
jgi:hypothetical protein